MFAISKLESFPAHTITGNAAGRNFVVTVEGKDNRPVNMSMVFTFYPWNKIESAWDGKKSTSQMTYYTIEFADLEGVITRWYYPATDSGKSKRDIDLECLLNDFGVRRRKHGAEF